jgi:hypothetical protein
VQGPRSGRDSKGMSQTPCNETGRETALRETPPRAAGVLAVAVPSREIVFVDTAVPDLDALVEVVGQTCEVVVLGATADALAQMEEALSARHSMDTVHVLAHGAPGAVWLGSTAMDDEVLARLGRRLRAAGHGLSATGRLLLYRVFRRD